MKIIKRSIKVLKYTGTFKMLISFLVFYSIISIAIWLIEPEIKTIGDGFWYCFAASTTIGFGDMVAVTRIGRVLTGSVAVYGIVVTAMIPGVVVSYYMEYLKLRENDTISMFLEKLEHLPELSKEELSELSDRVKQFGKRNK